MQHRIRLATADDAGALALLGAATVLETYHTILPGADLLHFCATKHSPAHYTAWLTDPACTIWIADAAQGAPIGYLVLTPASLPIEAPEAGDLEVVRIYVLHPFHKSGLGHRLMALAIDDAKRRGAKRLVLGMNTENARALAFYKRQGFEIIGERDFVVGNTICSDYVLALALNETAA